MLLNISVVYEIGFQLNHSSMSSVLRWYWRTNGNIFNLKKIWNPETINNSTNWIRIECCSNAVHMPPQDM